MKAQIINISEIGISICLPDFYSYFSRSYFNEDAPEADYIRENRNALLKDQTFFLDAYNWGNFEFPEILLTAVNVPGKDLKFAGEDALNFLLSGAAEIAELTGSKLYGNEIVRFDDIVYIRTLLKSRNSDLGTDIDIYVIQYYTVIANKAITIRFQTYGQKPKRVYDEFAEIVAGSVKVVSPEVIVPSQMCSSSEGYFGEKISVLPFDGWLIDCSAGKGSTAFGTQNIMFFSEDKLCRIGVSCVDVENAIQAQGIDIPDVNYSFPLDNIYTVSMLLNIENSFCKPDAAVKHSYINGEEYYILPVKGEDNTMLAVTLKDGYYYAVSFVDKSLGKYSDFLMEFLNKIRINGSTNGDQ